MILRRATVLNNIDDSVIGPDFIELGGDLLGLGLGIWVDLGLKIMHIVDHTQEKARNNWFQCESIDIRIIQ